jgi:DNA-binding transcriptional LysR family regulator
MGASNRAAVAAARSFRIFHGGRKRSMAKAGVRLNVSTPSISEIIAGLEHALGVRLLDRSPRGVLLTPYGAALLKGGEAAFDELRQGIRAIEFLTDPAAGELKIGCPESIAGAILPQIVQSFSREYPRVIVKVDNVPTPALTHPGLRDRKYDLFLARLGEKPLDDLRLDELNVETLFDDPLVLAAGVQNPWTRRRKINLADLTNESWILPPPHSWERGFLEKAFQTQGLEVPPASLVTLSVPFRQHLLAHGPYITTMALSVARFNGLKALSMDLPAWPFPVVVATLKNRTLSPIVERFVECARKVASSIAVQRRPRKARTSTRCRS